MEQERFNYLLLMQSQWRKQYAIQQQENKKIKKEVYKSKHHYSNSAEYQRHRNRSDVDTSL
jgi:hypothetical protein